MNMRTDSLAIPLAVALLSLAALVLTADLLGAAAQDSGYETAPQGADAEDVRFETLTLHIDTQDETLAAWQVAFTAPSNVKLVGIENGEVADEPPHYDPAAMMNNRIILAQFSLDSESNLARGEVRVATLHVRIEGELNLDEIELELAAAANFDGERIDDAQLRLEKTNDTTSKGNDHAR